MITLMDNASFIIFINSLPSNITYIDFITSLTQLKTENLKLYNEIGDAATREEKTFDVFCKYFFENKLKNVFNLTEYNFGLIHKEALNECKKLDSNDMTSPALYTIATITKNERGFYSNGDTFGKSKFIHARDNKKNTDYNVLFLERAKIPIVYGCINFHLDNKHPLSNNYANALNFRHENFNENESFIANFLAYEIINSKMVINHNERMPSIVLAHIKSKEDHHGKENKKTNKKTNKK